MKISIGNDHAGTEYKLAIVGLLKSMSIEVINHGTDGSDSVDYPDFIHPVAADVENKRADSGIIICGSGNGASMTANKHQGIRSALCWNKEISKLAKTHNNANIISLPGRFITFEEAKEILDTFFNTNFEGGRHSRRINKISC